MSKPLQELSVWLVYTEHTFYCRYREREREEWKRNRKTEVRDLHWLVERSVYVHQQKHCLFNLTKHLHLEMCLLFSIVNHNVEINRISAPLVTLNNWNPLPRLDSVPADIR